jgi:uncharacterized protein
VKKIINEPTDSSAKSQTRILRPDFLEKIEKRFPGLVEKIRIEIQHAENEFAGGELQDSFLWEHSLHVAYLAWKLAAEEKMDGFLAGLTALLHDAGKFEDGLYHRGEKPEEEGATKLARKILKSRVIGKTEREKIIEALKALYQEGAAANPLADLIHDADFLSKFGLMGVANFFIKTTLRGRNLHGAIMNHLSKELTYASLLPGNMRTSAGRKLARKKAMDSLNFYRNFLKEIRQVHGLGYRLKKVKISLPDSALKKSDSGSETSPVRGQSLRRIKTQRAPFIYFWLVMTNRCDWCGNGWQIQTDLDKGLKCRQVRARVVCRRCRNNYEVVFCLPEILPANSEQVSTLDL